MKTTKKIQINGDILYMVEWQENLPTFNVSKRKDGTAKIFLPVIGPLSDNGNNNARKYLEALAVAIDLLYKEEPKKKVMFSKKKAQIPHL